MTLHILDIESRDVTARALGLVVNAEIPVPLAQLTVVNGNDSVVLGVLGASHAVKASLGGHHITEQVSCDAVRAGGQPLPVSERASGYHFTSDTRTVDRVHLEETADWLRRQATEADGWICGSFPGDPTALTALTAQSGHAGGWAWQTWHLYPGEKDGVIVETRSRWQP